MNGGVFFMRHAKFTLNRTVIHINNSCSEKIYSSLELSIIALLLRHASCCRNIILVLMVHILVHVMQTSYALRYSQRIHDDCMHTHINWRASHGRLNGHMRCDILTKRQRNTPENII